MADPTAKITNIDTSALGKSSDVALAIDVTVEHDGATYQRQIIYRLPDVNLNTTNQPPTAAAVQADVVAAAQAVRQLKDLAASLVLLKDVDLVAANVPPVKV